MVSLGTSEWRLENIQGVLFDKDGTIIDSHVYWGRIIERRSRAILERYSLDESLFDDVCMAMGYYRGGATLVPEGPIALVSRDEVVNVVIHFLKKKGVRVSAEDLGELFKNEHEAFLEEINHYIRILPGVQKMLQVLQDFGVKNIVVTTDSVRNTEQVLRHLEIDSYINAVIGKESTIEPKVTGVPALLALKLANLQAKEVISIGDAPMDIIMAAKSGLKAGLGVSTGQVSYNELSSYTRYCARSLQNINIENCSK